MPRVKLVAVLGIIALLGAVGCSAEADSGGTPSVAATPTETAPGTPAPTSTGAGDPDIAVRLNPNRVIAGENSSVWILANCPVPSGGPDHRGAASSEAFSRAVTLDPVPPPTPTATPEATTSPVPIPWVRGEAQVPSTVQAGTYRVNVTCEGTNDTGRADLRVAAPPSVVPTKAPRAGGGGMAAGAAPAEEGSGFPGVPLGLAITVAAVGGIVIARRNA